MGHFPIAVLVACLNVLRWLFYVAGGLMAVLVVVQHLRGDEAAAPLPLALGATMMLLLGFVSGKVSAFLETSR